MPGSGALSEPRRFVDHHHHHLGTTLRDVKRHLAVVILAAGTTACATDSSSTDELRDAVQNYSDANLGGDPDTAWAAISPRCQARIDRSAFDESVVNLSQVVPEPLDFATWRADKSGQTANVWYTFDDPLTALNQPAEAWILVDGSWRWDDC